MRDISGWLPEAEESVLCGVSGGVDSMVLLDLLRDWCARHGGSVTAAHYNHIYAPRRTVTSALCATGAPDTQ